MKLERLPLPIIPGDWILALACLAFAFGYLHLCANWLFGAIATKQKIAKEEQRREARYSKIHFGILANKWKGLERNNIYIYQFPKLRAPLTTNK